MEQVFIGLGQPNGTDPQRCTILDMALTGAFHDISDPSNVRSGMRKALQCLRDAAQGDSELWTGCYVFACTCIDGLTRPRPGHVGQDIVAYVGANFKALDSTIGAQAFYDNFRCDAVHQFAMKAPYAIGRGLVTDPYVIADPIRTILNVDRFVQDVLDHLAPPLAAMGGGSMHSTITSTTTGRP